MEFVELGSPLVLVPHADGRASQLKPVYPSAVVLASGANASRNAGRSVDVAALTASCFDGDVRAFSLDNVPLQEAFLLMLDMVPWLSSRNVVFVSGVW